MIGATVIATQQATGVKISSLSNAKHGQFFVWFVAPVSRARLPTSHGSIWFSSFEMSKPMYLGISAKLTTRLVALPLSFFSASLRSMYNLPLSASLIPTLRRSTIWSQLSDELKRDLQNTCPISSLLSGSSIKQICILSSVPSGHLTTHGISVAGTGLPLKELISVVWDSSGPNILNPPNIFTGRPSNVGGLSPASGMIILTLVGFAAFSDGTFEEKLLLLSIFFKSSPMEANWANSLSANLWSESNLILERRLMNELLNSSSTELRSRVSISRYWSDRLTAISSTALCAWWLRWFETSFSNVRASLPRLHQWLSSDQFRSKTLNSAWKSRPLRCFMPRERTWPFCP